MMIAFFPFTISPSVNHASVKPHLDARHLQSAHLSPFIRSLHRTAATLRCCGAAATGQVWHLYCEGVAQLLALHGFA
jgi:hypothetical protein